MKYIKTFEELNARFSSKEEQKAYYRAKALEGYLSYEILVNMSNILKEKI
jgi:hypothetical protein